jgi:lipopolysaccharide export system protein LptC
METMSFRLPSLRPQNYTGLVRRLRVILPVLAVLMLALVVIWPHFDPAQTPKRHANAAPPEMNHSHFSGVDKKNRPFTITADRAVQKSTSSNDVDLTKPVGKLILQNGKWVTLSADQGDYREDNGTITLQGDVTLTHSNGYVVKTSAAAINMDDGIATSDKPTEGEGPRGQIQGEGFHMDEEHDQIIFTGNSRILILPDQDDDSAPADAAPAAAPAGGAQ